MMWWMDGVRVEERNIWRKKLKVKSHAAETQNSEAGANDDSPLT